MRYKTKRCPDSLSCVHGHSNCWRQCASMRKKNKLLSNGPGSFHIGVRKSYYTLHHGQNCRPVQLQLGPLFFDPAQKPGRFGRLLRTIVSMLGGSWIARTLLQRHHSMHAIKFFFTQNPDQTIKWLYTMTRRQCACCQAISNALVSTNSIGEKNS